MTRWIARGVGVVALLSVAVFASLVGWAREMSRTDPHLVLEMLPGQSDALLAVAEAARMRDGAIGETVLATGARLMRSEPLSEAPLVFVALARVAEGDSDAAREVFSAVRARQPRNIAALSWLAADALTRGDHVKAAALLERLQALNHELTNVYAEAWATTIETSEGASVLEERLAAGSILARKTLDVVTPTLDNIDLLVRLYAHVPDQQSRLLGSLLRTQGPVRTFLAWLELAPSVETHDFSWPFDPAFVGSAAPPPFNWTLGREAEILKEGGLYVGYSGRGAPELAGQLMLLTHGRYEFKAEMQGNTDPSKGAFVWSVQCDPPAGVQIATVEVSTLSSNPREFAAAFVVPQESCASQALTLRARPGEFPARVTAIVHRVSVQPAGGVP